MVASTAEVERPMLRMGSIAFFVGLVIAVVSTFVFHPSGTGEETNEQSIYLWSVC